MNGEIWVWKQNEVRDLYLSHVSSSHFANIVAIENVQCSLQALLCHGNCLVTEATKLCQCWQGIVSALLRRPSPLTTLACFLPRMGRCGFGMQQVFEKQTMLSWRGKNYAVWQWIVKAAFLLEQSPGWAWLGGSLRQCTFTAGCSSELFLGHAGRPLASVIDGHGEGELWGLIAYPAEVRFGLHKHDVDPLNMEVIMVGQALWP
jgi:hypothetical protein